MRLVAYGTWVIPTRPSREFTRRSPWPRPYPIPLPSPSPCSLRSYSTSSAKSGNSLKNGLLPIIVPQDVHKELLASPGAVLKVDLAAESLTLPTGKAVKFPIDPFSKQCMLDGVSRLAFDASGHEVTIRYPIVFTPN